MWGLFLTLLDGFLNRFLEGIGSKKGIFTRFVTWVPQAGLGI